ncbi:hypothetical protein [Pseudorhodobacter ferrugineus]|uniref:hypothetical protein n=1 Tax=Pseudorhodobacter ferrugineus TaxID=77008 RepID=UPI0009DC26F4|nr:hypothetical protein [Pseudorhodobacter ferrugineus]
MTVIFRLIRHQVSAAMALFALLVFAGCTATVPAADQSVEALTAATSEVAEARGAPQPEPLSAVKRIAGPAKLGTKWGEGVASSVSTVNLKRVSQKPVDVGTLRYGAVQGGGAAAQEVLIAEVRVGLRVLRANGKAWPMFGSGDAARLQGQSGERYILAYQNYSRSKTYELVVTVDGLDVLSGKPGSLRGNGYVLRPGETLRIEGFRKSRAEVAAFRFSSAAESYAANIGSRSTRNIGVIGTAVFELRAKRPVPECSQPPCAFPADTGTRGRYAPAPTYD